MFHIYHSNHLDFLKSLAARVIQIDPLDDPLTSEIILVQSTSMAQWLKIELAQTFGISANIKFPLPASFIWEMFSHAMPDIPVESVFSKTSMSWKLMHRLPTMLKKKEFISLRHYLSDDNERRKLFQLSSRIADLFDQYLVYRPDWLNRWERSENVEGLDDGQDWQSILWRDLVKYTEELGQPKWHRANLYTRFINYLEQSKYRPATLPKRVFICGISALPPVYLKTLKALGSHIDIYLLFTNPCRDYWGDIQDYAFLSKLKTRQSRRQDNNTIQKVPCNDVGSAPMMFNERTKEHQTNPLLASWGKLGRDNLELLSQMEVNSEIDAFVDIDEDTLLHSIQYDLLNLQDRAIVGLTASELLRSEKKRCLDPADRSISVNICYSVQREVEVLQDHLLALLDADPQLKARDVIVMVADIETYAPFIQAVFANTQTENYLPFSISDRRASQAHPAIVAFLRLLELPNSRFASEDVLSLLDVPALASRFCIDESGLHLLRRWVRESGIRWGLNDTSVEALSLPVTGQHTWCFGLRRMLLGYAMESKHGDWQGILPYDESSGMIAELAGHLADFLSCLNQWHQILTQPRPLEAWFPLYRELINAFFSPDPEAEGALLLVEEQWKSMINYGLNARFQDTISVGILLDDLRNRLDQKHINQRFLAGHINFCTLMPMRSIPFRVVCLLGMNDGIYPRMLSPLSFDLMQKSSRKGDRSRRDDDRYLFLEALISAQHQLYISYIGRSIRDNTKRYPSVLVTELLEYIGQSFYLPGDENRQLDDSAQRVILHLEHLHSRTPFSPENFKLTSPVRSFASAWLPAARGTGQPQPNFVKPLLSLPLETLTLDQFLRFWQHPVRTWFQQRLGVNFSLKDRELLDIEPFSLDSLDRYQINAQLLDAIVEGADTDRLYAYYRAAGDLPYGAFGKLAWQTQYEEMQKVAAEVITQGKDGQSWEVNLSLAGVALTGWLHQVQNNGLLRWRPSILNINDGLLLWLEHLTYCALGGMKKSQMFGCKQSRWCFCPLSSQEASIQLEKYIEGYILGMREPLMLLSRSGGAWLKTVFDNKTKQLMSEKSTQYKARHQLLAAWNGNYQMDGEGRDPYLHRLCRVLDESQLQCITETAKKWYLPVLKSNQDEK